MQPNAAAQKRLFKINKTADADFQPRVYAYYFKQWNGFHMPFHRHDSTEIMYVISGTCTVEVGSASLELKRGEFIVISCGAPHRLLVEGTCRMLNLEFGFVPGTGEGPSIAGLAGQEPALRSLLDAASDYLLLSDPDEVYHSLRSLVLELDNRGKQGSPLARLVLAQLLIRIARLREETVAGLQPEDRYIRQSIEFLRQNYDRDIRVGDVAAAVNLHPGYLQRIFKRSTGRTLVEALTEIRIDKAKMLLKRTDIPVTDIYDYVGIGSRQYFHALFRKHVRMTPLEFRRSPDAELWNFEESSDF